MFYAYVLNTGQFIDLGHADILTQGVDDLRSCLAAELSTPEEELILMTKDGKIMDDTARVTGYAAGTDTRPVLVVNHTLLKDERYKDIVSHQESSKLSGDLNLNGHFRTAMAYAPSLETVRKRLALVERLTSYGREMMGGMESMVRDQEYVQQSLDAIIATIEPMTNAMAKREATLVEKRNAFLSDVPLYKKLVEEFPAVRKTLSEICLPDCIHGSLTSSRRILRGTSPSNSQSASTSSFLDPVELPPTGCSLLDWIQSQVGTKRIGEALETCINGLEKVDANFPEDYQDCHSAFTDKMAYYDEMKDIPGLAGRCSSLQEVLEHARRFLTEQQDHTASMRKQYGALQSSAISDPASISDMCESHKGTVEQICLNQKEIGKLFNSVLASKIELCGHLHVRLQWLTALKQAMAECDASIIPAVEYIRLLGSRFDMLNSLSQTPELYCSGLVECRRQLLFGSRYYEWYHAMLECVRAVVMEETQYRQLFVNAIKKHFVQSLFPGICTGVTVFVGELPAEYRRPPSVTPADLEYLTKQCPQVKTTDWYSRLTSLQESPAFGSSATQLAMEECNKELAELRTQQQQTIEELKQCSNMKDRLELSLQESQAQFASLQREANAARQHAADEEASFVEQIVDLQSRVSTAENQEQCAKAERLKESAALTGDFKAQLLSQRRQLVEQHESDLVSLEEKLKSQAESERRMEAEALTGKFMTQLAAQRQELIEQHGSELTRLRERLASESAAEAERLHEQLEQAMESSSSSVGEVAEQNKELLRQLSEARGKVDTSKKVHEMAIARMLSKHQQEKKTAEEQLAAEKEKCSQFVAFKDQFAAERTSLETQIQQLKDTIKTAEGDRDAVYFEFHECKRDLNALRQSAAAAVPAHDHHSTECSADTQNFKDEIARLQAELQKKNEDISAAVAERDAMDRQYHECRRDLNVALSESGSPLGGSSRQQPAESASRPGSVGPETDAGLAGSMPTVGSLEQAVRTSSPAASVSSAESGAAAAAAAASATATRDMSESEVSCETCKKQLLELKVWNTRLEASMLESPEKAKKMCAVMAKATAKGKGIKLGDILVFFYSERFKAYIPATRDTSETSGLYFLSTKSYADLGIPSSADDGEMPAYIIGLVTDRQRCEARKKANRYNVPLNTRFYLFSAVAPDA